VRDGIAHARCVFLGIALRVGGPAASIPGPVFESLRSRFFRKPTLIPGGANVPEGEARSHRVELPDGSSLGILISRVDGRLRALDSLCPHAGGRISQGPLAGGVEAVCPLHLMYFNVKDGCERTDSCAPARVIRIRERGGDAAVWA